MAKKHEGFFNIKGEKNPVYDRIRTGIAKTIDPTLLLSEEIAKFIMDWSAVNKLKKIDKIEVIMRISKIHADDLKKTISWILFKTPAEKADLEVKVLPGKYRCHWESHITHFEHSCHICGSPSSYPLPMIKLRITSGKKTAEIQFKTPDYSLMPTKSEL